MEPQIEPRLKDATLFTGEKLAEFVYFLQTGIDSDLSPLEATLLAGVLLENLPRLVTEDKRFYNAIKHTANAIKALKVENRQN